MIEEIVFYPSSICFNKKIIIFVSAKPKRNLQEPLRAERQLGANLISQLDNLLFRYLIRSLAALISLCNCITVSIVDWRLFSLSSMSAFSLSRSLR